MIQDTNLEAAFLSSLLRQERSRFFFWMEQLRGSGVKLFYSPLHSAFYMALVGVAKGGYTPFDTEVFSRELGRFRVLTEAPTETKALVALGATVISLDVALKELTKLSALRAIQESVETLAARINKDSDPAEIVSSLSLAINQTAVLSGRTARPSLAQAFDDEVAELRTIAASGQRIRGLPTGILGLDHAIMGLKPGDLVIIGGRPGWGKTAMLVSVIAHITRDPDVYGYFNSREMSRGQIIDRLISIRSGINLSTISSPGSLTAENWIDIHQTRGLFESQLDIEDQAVSFDTLYMDVIAKSLHRKIGFVAIDYVQMMADSMMAEQNYRVDKRHLIANIISRSKDLAKKLKCPVILLSQLKREVEQRAWEASKKNDLAAARPRPSDLDEAKEIEAGADIILFPFRPSMYGFQCKPDQAEIYIGKQRNGMADIAVPARYVDTLTWYTNPKGSLTTGDIKW